MAKRKSAVPARKPQGEQNSPLLRSAEALGRMIGALQRQIDRISKQLPIDLAHSTETSPRKRKAAGGKKKATKARAKR